MLLLFIYIYLYFIVFRLLFFRSFFVFISLCDIIAYNLIFSQFKYISFLNLKFKHFVDILALFFCVSCNISYIYEGFFNILLGYTPPLFLKKSTKPRDTPSKISNSLLTYYATPSKIKLSRSHTALCKEDKKCQKMVKVMKKRNESLQVLF